MEVQFYFISNKYFQDFPDKRLMNNKEGVNGTISRPCFLSFCDSKYDDIYWLVPVSSQYEKYKKIEQHKISKTGKCDTLHFGKMLGRDCAFLIQNMFPATKEYMTEYRNKYGEPIRIDNRIVKTVQKKATNVLKLAEHGVDIIFPNSLAIYDVLAEKIRLSNMQDIQQKLIQTFNEQDEGQGFGMGMM